MAMPEFLSVVRQNPVQGYDIAASNGYLYYSSFFLSAAVNIFAVSISCLPYAMAYLEDKQSDYDRYFISRTDIKRYSLSKFVINLLATVFVAFLGYLLAVLVFILLCGGQAGQIMQGDGSSLTRAIASKSPINYILLLSLYSSLYCGMWSSFVLAISSYLENLYIIFALTYAGVLVTGKLKLTKFALPMFSKLAMRGAWLGVEGVPFSLAMLLNIVQYIVIYVVLFALFYKRVRLNFERK
ncbi:MAG: hypothetical protein Q4E09_06205 [Eubacteriales bacterium]|nr:hypothetical protein [Eubacteriales bacterium]